MKLNNFDLLYKPPGESADFIKVILGTALVLQISSDYFILIWI